MMGRGLDEDRLEALRRLNLRLEEEIGSLKGRIIELERENERLTTALVRHNVQVKRGESVRSQEGLEPLSGVQRAVLRFIAWHRLHKGMSPSLREICQQMGTRSLNGVSGHLDQLEAKGYVERHHGKARGTLPLVRVKGIEDPERPPRHPTRKPRRWEGYRRR